VRNDAYYKKVTNPIDDGQFGQAYVLTGFNYDKAFNKGVELTAKYKYGNLRAYANLAWAAAKRDQLDLQPVPVR